MLAIGLNIEGAESPRYEKIAAFWQQYACDPSRRAILSSNSPEVSRGVLRSIAVQTSSSNIDAGMSKAQLPEGILVWNESSNTLAAGSTDEKSMAAVGSIIESVEAVLGDTSEGTGQPTYRTTDESAFALRSLVLRHCSPNQRLIFILPGWADSDTDDMLWRLHALSSISRHFAEATLLTSSNEPASALRVLERLQATDATWGRTHASPPWLAFDAETRSPWADGLAAGGGGASTTRGAPATTSSSSSGAHSPAPSAVAVRMRRGPTDAPVAPHDNPWGMPRSGVSSVPTPVPAATVNLPRMPMPLSAAASAPAASPGRAAAAPPASELPQRGEFPAASVCTDPVDASAAPAPAPHADHAAAGAADPSKASNATEPAAIRAAHPATSAASAGAGKPATPAPHRPAAAPFRARPMSIEAWVASATAPEPGRQSPESSEPSPVPPLCDAFVLWDTENIRVPLEADVGFNTAHFPAALRRSLAAMLRGDAQIGAVHVLAVHGSFVKGAALVQLDRWGYARCDVGIKQGAVDVGIHQAILCLTIGWMDAARQPRPRLLAVISSDIDFAGNLRSLRDRVPLFRSGVFHGSNVNRALLSAVDAAVQWSDVLSTTRQLATQAAVQQQQQQQQQVEIPLSALLLALRAEGHAALAAQLEEAPAWVADLQRSGLDVHVTLSSVSGDPSGGLEYPHDRPVGGGAASGGSRPPLRQQQQQQPQRRGLGTHPLRPSMFPAVAAAAHPQTRAAHRSPSSVPWIPSGPAGTPTHAHAAALEAATDAASLPPSHGEPPARTGGSSSPETQYGSDGDAAPGGGGASFLAAAHAGNDEPQPMHARGPAIPGARAGSHGASLRASGCPAPAFPPSLPYAGGSSSLDAPPDDELEWTSQRAAAAAGAAGAELGAAQQHDWSAVMPHPSVRLNNPEANPLYKTQLCKHWMTLGQCRFGRACGYAHGSSELRPYGGGAAAPGSHSSAGEDS